MIISLLILISQTLNVLHGGDEDEMLSSRTWRCRNDHWYWSTLLWLLDDVVFRWWTDGNRKHCQWCFDSELERVKRKVKEWGDAHSN